MQNIQHNIVRLGGVNGKCPSVFFWLLQPQHVYIGPSTVTVLGTGEDYEELERIEKYSGTAANATSSKFIAFHDASGIEAAIREFPWRVGVSYSFGYHQGLLPVHLLRMFTAKIVELMLSAGIVVRFNLSAHDVTSIYLEHFTSKDEACIAHGITNTWRGASFIGRGSIWDDVANETTAEFVYLVERVQEAVPSASGADLYRPIEYAIAHCEEALAKWQAIYRTRLLDNDVVQALISSGKQFGDGTTFFMDLDHWERMLRIGDTSFALRAGTLQRDRGQKVVYLDDLLPRVPKTVPKVALYAGLQRIVPILEIMGMPGNEIELRYGGTFETSPDPPEPGDTESRIVLSAVCACCRIMPDLTRTQLKRLRDPQTTREMRAEIVKRYKRPFARHCWVAMMSPRICDVPTYDPKIYNVNPPLPPPSTDNRVVVMCTNFPQQTEMYPANALIWSNRARGPPVDTEKPPRRRYIARGSMPQVTEENMKFMRDHPDGFIDHMRDYHADGQKTELCAAPLRPVKPPSEIVFPAAVPTPSTAAYR